MFFNLLELLRLEERTKTPEVNKIYQKSGDRLEN